VELIEPSLYLRMHPDAPAAFADALEATLDLPASRTCTRP